MPWIYSCSEKWVRPYFIYLGLPVSKITISLDNYQVIGSCLKMMQKKYFLSGENNDFVWTKFKGWARMRGQWNGRFSRICFIWYDWYSKIFKYLARLLQLNWEEISECMMMHCEMVVNWKSFDLKRSFTIMIIFKFKTGSGHFLK